MSTEVMTLSVHAMNGSKSELTFYNADLIKHTENIQKYRDAGNLAILAIAHEFDKMDCDESYKTAGFKSVSDFGRIVFDYKPATVSLYTRSARAFLTEKNGMVDFKDGLPKLSLGQMIELLPLVKDETNVDAVVKAFQSGDVNDRMSTKALRDVVSSIRAIPVKTKEAKHISATESAAKIGDFTDDNKRANKQGKENLLIVYMEAARENINNVSKVLDSIETTISYSENVKAIYDSINSLDVTINKILESIKDDSDNVENK